MLIILVSWLMTLMMVIIFIPYLTLLERKVLSYIQLRKGPNKVGFLGLLQPISDGVKLFFKESGSVIFSKNLFYYFSSLFKFFIMLNLYLIFSPIFPAYSLNLGFIGYLCLSSLLVYTMIFSGWSSKSKYSLLGSLRGASQMISYEIVVMTIMFFPFILRGGYNIQKTTKKYSLMFMLFFVMLIMWLLSMVAETNRSPFDFAEGESELVSGFKTEYSGFLFALLFLGEYGKIMYVSFLTKFIFFHSSLTYLDWLFPMFLVFFFLLLRGTFPRFRYDLLMNFTWQVVLPTLLLLLNLIYLF